MLIGYSSFSTYLLLGTKTIPLLHWTWDSGYFFLLIGLELEREIPRRIISIKRIIYFAPLRMTCSGGYLLH
jgi:hypothetical protein